MSGMDGFRLVTLGRLALVGPRGEVDDALNTRRRKVALLAVLALAGRPVARDSLLEMFWGDQDETRARHSLSDALSHLRRVLGRDAIVTTRAEAGVAAGAPLVVDAVDLAAAVEQGDLERALGLYTGPFLDAVYVADSASFEQWATRHRRRLDTLFLHACAARCDQLAQEGDWTECAAVADRWLDVDPLSATAAAHQLMALDAPGTVESGRRALAAYERLRTRLSRELELEPDAAVQRRAESIAERVARAARPSGPPAVQSTAAAAQVADHSSTTAIDMAPSDGVRRSSPHRLAAAPLAAPALAAPPTVSPRRARITPRRAVAAFVLLLGTALTGLVLRGAATHAQEQREAPTIAIPSFDELRSDSGITWLGEGLPQMMAAELARSTMVDVVAPARMRAVELRARMPGLVPRSPDEARELARRVGATLVAHGAFARDGDTLVLSLTVLDVATGRALRSDALTSTDALTLADLGAARILVAAHAEGPGLRLAELETSRVEAYQHFVAGVNLQLEGRGAEASRELDAAIALDSGFVSALQERWRLAMNGNEVDVLARLNAAIARSEARATGYERLRQQALSAFLNGEHERSEALARQLVQRYPRDPRTYETLADILNAHGHWTESEALHRTALSIDSLGLEAGEGPCGSCIAYGALAAERLWLNDLAGAEHAARRWVALQPNVPAAWGTLSFMLASSLRYDEALAAARRAATLTGDEPATLAAIGRLMLADRRYEAVDSALEEWGAKRDPARRAMLLDLRAMLQRERGQWRASNRTIERAVAEDPSLGFLELVRGNSLGRIGAYAMANALYERSVHGVHRAPMTEVTPLGARGFCWHHALEADALAPQRDRRWLVAIADSLEHVCARSYFGRDWRLHHHVRGLIAMLDGKPDVAVREFHAARWGLGGWTRTLVEEARADLALGRPRDAVTALREAYAAPLDAMGRYVPHSELDYHLAVALQVAGEIDSARVYAAYARRAWRDADVEARSLLAGLP